MVGFRKIGFISSAVAAVLADDGGTIPVSTPVFKISISDGVSFSVSREWPAADFGYHDGPPRRSRRRDWEDRQRPKHRRRR